MTHLAKIGRCSVDLVVRGCAGCGTEHSSGWYTHSIHTVVYFHRPNRPKEISFEVHLCEDCRKNQEAR